jgi:hypothetical protein
MDYLGKMLWSDLTRSGFLKDCIRDGFDVAWRDWRAIRIYPHLPDLSLQLLPHVLFGFPIDCRRDRRWLAGR